MLHTGPVESKSWLIYHSVIPSYIIELKEVFTAISIEDRTQNIETADEDDE